MLKTAKATEVLASFPPTLDPLDADTIPRHRLLVLATGFRNPNGLGASPDGKIITAAPQQGTWTPSSQICAIQPGGYYGYGGPKVTPGRPLELSIPCGIQHSGASYPSGRSGAGFGPP